MKKLETAATLAAMGLKLIPAHSIKNGVCTCDKGAQCTSAGKHPTQTNWQNKSVSSEELIAMLKKNPDLNFGVVTGGRLFVVDIDPKNGGLESFAEIEGLFNPTFKVVTGSGGYHFYYLLPEGYDKPIGNKVNIIKGIDIRGENGFVVAPSSLHKSGNTYEIAEDSLDEIQVIGEELLELITKEKDYNTGQEARVETVDTFGEGERNARITAIAGSLFRQGLSKDAVVDSLLSLNESICSPPLHPKEITTIVRSVSKYKNHEQVADCETQYSSVHEEIEDYLYHVKGNVNLKSKHIAELIVTDLLDKGAFYKSFEDVFYFDNDSKVLIAINKENINFKKLLADYKINASTSFYKYVFEEIFVFAYANATETNIYKYAHYNQSGNVVYIKNGNGMYKITSSEISFCDNGTDGILFSDAIIVSTFNYIEDADGEDYICKYIASLGTYDETYMDSVTQRNLVKAYFISLIMPEFLQTKPIFVAVGVKGSSKTTLLKAIVKCLYGIKHSVLTMPSKPDDLDVIMTQSHFAAIDNVDTYKESLNDKFAVYATGGYIKKRKLFTDNTMCEAYIDSFLGITTRMLAFRRDDILQRLLLVFLDSIKTGYKAESDLINPIMKNRDLILTQAINAVQKVLSVIATGKYNNFVSNFRMSDFARFLTILLDDHEQAESYLAKLSKLQRSASMENDVLIPYLTRYIIDLPIEKQGAFLPAHDIYRTLEGYSRTMSENTLLRSDFTQAYNTVIGFSKRLNNIKDDIKEYISIETRRGSGNQSLYRCSRGERFDDLPSINIITV